MRVRSAAPLLAALLAQGCALLSRGTPLKPHYYEPPPPQHAAAAEPLPTCALQLGDVIAEDGLGRSIAFRRSPYEIGFYETRRWSESPENYLRRALERGLFEDARCRRVLADDGPTLDARLLTFEERRGQPPSARVAVHVIVHDGSRVLAEATFHAERSFEASDGDAAFDAFVAAVAHALDEVVAEVVGLVARASADAEPGRGVLVR